MAPVDVEDVWDLLGFGRIQLAIFFSCCIMQMYVTNEQLGLSVVLVAGACDLGMNNERMGWLIAVIFFGQVLSGHYFGHMADKIGRIKVLLKTSIMTILFSFLSAFMPEFWSFLVLRFIVGVFITGIAVTLLTYLSEFTRLSLRPKVNNYFSYPIGVSMIYVPVVALILLSLNIHIKLWENYAIKNWRVLIVLNLLPGIIGVCLLYRLPESAKFYLSIDKEAEAMAVLERCCRINKGKGVTLASLGVNSVTQAHLRDDHSEHNAFSSLWYDTVPLFRGDYLRYMILTSVATFILFAAGFGLNVWILRIRFITQQINEPLILCDLLDVAQNYNKTLSEAVCDLNLDSMTVSIVLGCTTLITLIITSIMFTFIRRRTILLVFTLLAAFVGFLLNVVKDDTVIVAIFILFVVLPLCCLRLTMSMLIDLIPTHLRAKGVAVIFVVGRIGVMSASLFMGYTLKLCCLITFNAFVLGLLVAALMIYLLPTEDFLKERDNKAA